MGGTCSTCVHFQHRNDPYGKCRLVESFPFWSALTTTAEHAGESLYPTKFAWDACDYHKDKAP